MQTVMPPLNRNVKLAVKGRRDVIQKKKKKKEASARTTVTPLKQNGRAGGASRNDVCVVECGRVLGTVSISRGTFQQLGALY